MGKIASKLVRRPIRNFNVETRAHNLVDKDVKPNPAPLHESSKEYITQFVTENKEMLDKQLLSKNESLHERLKGIVVETKSPGEIKAKLRPLPEDRTKIAETEYGYTEPSLVREGHLTIKQAMEMLGKHSAQPVMYPAEKMAHEYKMNVDDVRVILQYFKVFRLHLPTKEGGEGHGSLLQPPLLSTSKGTDGEKK